MFIGHLYDKAGAYQPRFILYLAVIAFAAAAISLLLRKTPHWTKADVQAISAPISLEE